MAVIKKVSNNSAKFSTVTILVTLFVPAISLLSCRILYGQTLQELNTTMAVEEELRGREAHPAAPKQAPGNAEQPGMEKLEKSAQKLLKAMQSGVFDRSDFSSAWDAIVPKNADFSAGLNAICKPVFDQLGRPERLGPGHLVGPNIAVFPVQCARGDLLMTVSLDPQEKINEWTLTPAGAPAQMQIRQNIARPQMQELETPDEGRQTDSDMADINDFNSFQRELNLINIRTKGEEQQWLGPLERKQDLVRSIDELVAAELRFIRKLAETENAEQTVKAIDLVLRQRQERLNELTAKLDEELRNERQQQAAERNQRRAIRQTEGQDQQEQRQPRERPQRRVREPAGNNPQNQP
jgi:hypothetical protein